MDERASGQGATDPLEAVRDPERLAAVRQTGLHDPAAADSLGHLTTLALRSLDVSTAFVSVVDEDRVVVRAARGDPEPIIATGTVPVERSFCQNVVASGEPLSVADSREAPDSPGNRMATELGLVSYLEVPVRVGDDGPVAGGFGIGDARPREWTSEDRDLLQALAEGAASELELRRELRRLREREIELEHRALHDPLTGLANRQLFRHRVEHALARAERTGGITAILFVDVDDFKSVNDRLGHVAGDEVLTEIGEMLRDCVREPDSVARFGGDEFTVLLEDLQGPEEADQVAARIADRLRGPLEAAGASLELTVSIGVATTADGAAERGEEVGETGRTAGPASPGQRLVQRADWAMYRGKQEGRTTWERY